MILNKTSSIIDFNICLTNCKTYCKTKKSVVKLRNEPRCEKTGLWDFRQVQHKPGCTTTEDG